MFDIFGRKRIAELEKANFNLNQRLQDWEDRTGRDLERILKQVNAITPGLGRVIAKLDTQFGRAEIDPTRKAESDKLAEETILRLEAEAKAREPYNQ